MDGNALKQELLKGAHFVDGVGKHYVVNPSKKVSVTVLIGRDKEESTRTVSVQKIWTNCLEGANNVFIPWWTITKAEIL